jgi:hypothetical protein
VAQHSSVMFGFSAGGGVAAEAVSPSLTGAFRNRLLRVSAVSGYASRSRTCSSRTPECSDNDAGALDEASSEHVAVLADYRAGSATSS